MLSLVASVFAINAYKVRLQERAYNFANDAFEKVFAGHDTYFLLDHATDYALRTVGRDELTRFLSDATLRAGDVHDIKPAHGELVFRYVFPARIGTEGFMRTEGVGEHGRIQLHLHMNDFEGEWRMDNLAWIYPDSVRQSPAR